MSEGIACVRTVLSRAIGGLLLVSSPLFAESVAVPPERQFLDANGVDLLSGAFRSSHVDISIGPSDGTGLVYSRTATSGSPGVGFRASTDIHLKLNEYYEDPEGFASAEVRIGFSKEKFRRNGSTFTATRGSGATLVLDSASASYIYTGRDGTIIRFPSTGSGTGVGIAATVVEAPNGTRTQFFYKTWTEDICGTGCPQVFSRLQSIVNNAGYQLKFEYADPVRKDSVTRVSAINSALVYCDPDADSCTATAGAPSVTYAAAPGPNNNNPAMDPSTVWTITDPAGRVSRVTVAYNSHLGQGLQPGPSAVKSPSSTTDDTVIAYSYYGPSLYGDVVAVSSVSHRGLTWNYAVSIDPSLSQRTVTATDAMGNTRKVTSSFALSQVLTDTDGLNRQTAYQYDTLGRRTRITYPEGNYVHFTYDARGNITETRHVAKPGAGQPDIVTSATYPATCSNQKTCNKPTTTTDARGATTDYAYDPVHGGVLTVTEPAPVGGAIRPQTRYRYTALHAWVMNSAGTLVQAATPVYRLTEISRCRTAVTCAGAADEVKTSLSYQAGSSSAGSNLLLTTVSTGAGDNSIVATNTIAYDAIGNAVSVDGPMPGTADTVRTRYDVLRRVVGIVEPDPDGAGSLKNRAVRYSYNLDSQLTLSERGTVNSQADADWASFVDLEKHSVTYDAAGRKAAESQIAGGATVALTQYGYDAASRLECVTQRMNQATFASLPGACALGAEGSFGPDRITRMVYDAAHQLTKVQTGVGTAAQRDEITSVYSAGGKPLTLVDARGNKTTYEYDGFNRVAKMRMPSPTQPGTSSTSDYEQYTYDATANVTLKRLRDGQSIGYAYDLLGRLTSKDLPGAESDVTYGHDNLGHPTSIVQGGHSLGFGYDALGRVLTQSGPQGTLTAQYDLAGRRMRLTWPDAFYVTYDYLTTGEVLAVRENGATSGVAVLATFAYDNLGRRTSLTRGNGTVTGYSYGASGLSQLTQNLAATSADLTLGFGYNTAGQIVSRTASNDVYAWAQSNNVERGYTSNGLNQYATVGSAVPSYDSRGNLTNTGEGGAYGYSAENLLVSAPNAVALAYDPMRRLYQTVGSSTTRLAYDGDSLVAEYNGANQLLRRYVHGPGADEPLVWYEGAGTTTRRWLHADERGSIIAVSNATGGTFAVNRYDDYGLAQASNVGRFQYTGQTWLAEATLYYFKARMYSAGLGRFMQTDPIGYGGGMNRYAYVNGDPINRRDPSGLMEEVIVTGSRGLCQDWVTCLPPNEPFASIRSTPMPYVHPAEAVAQAFRVRGYLVADVTDSPDSSCGKESSGYEGRASVVDRTANAAEVADAGVRGAFGAGHDASKVSGYYKRLTSKIDLAADVSETLGDLAKGDTARSAAGTLDTATYFAGRPVVIAASMVSDELGGARGAVDAYRRSVEPIVRAGPVPTIIVATRALRGESDASKCSH